MISAEKKAWAEDLLRKKCEELGRLPKKEDFDEITRSRIKTILGPWPRALEAAGLKEAKLDQQNRKKRSGRKNNVRIAALRKLEKKRTQSES